MDKNGGYKGLQGLQVGVTCFLEGVTGVTSMGYRGLQKGLPQIVHGVTT